MLVVASEGFAYPGAQGDIRIDRLNSVIALTKTSLLTDTSMIDAWRAAGGALDIIGLSTEIEEATVTVAGSITLDHNFDAVGTLQTELTKPAGLAAFLETAGVLGANEAKAARAGLAMAALAQGGTVKAPITIKDGRAEISGVKIADVPRIVQHRH